MLVLGIETSCDETAAAVVRNGREVLSNQVYTQIARHRAYGGVVPEIASRCHVEELPGLIREALREAGVSWPEIDAVAVTQGPGLASSLLIGLSAAKSLSLRLDKPLLPINHLEAHLYSIWMSADAPSVESSCPVVVLLVTGGHTCLVRVDGIGRYRRLGETLDDAAGEALDKGAKLLGLGYPGGPAVEQAGLQGNPRAIAFPRGTVAPGAEPSGMYANCCFSFSGLKTALLYYLKEHPEAASAPALADVAASYQEAVIDALLDRLAGAVRRENVRTVACVGGVARNRRLRERLDRLAAEQGLDLLIAPFAYCTDNAAMVAALAGAQPIRAAENSAALDVQPNLVVGESEVY